MNLDLIIKLVKLANNNPNEHEANLAARKVCKLIADGKFDFGTIERVVDKPFQGGTWNDVKRSSEPMWSSKQQAPDPRAQQEHWEYIADLLKKMRQNSPFANGSWTYPREDPYESKYTKAESQYDYIEVDYDVKTDEYILPGGHRVSRMKFYSVPHNYKVREPKT